MSYKDTPFVENEQIIEFIKEYRNNNDQEAKKKIMGIIFLSYVPLAKTIVYSFARRMTDPVDDLFQVASIGIIKAIKSFNPKISNNFKPYVTSFIISEIKHYLRDKNSIIKRPRQIQELTCRIKKIVQELTLKYGYEPSDEEIAKALEIPSKKVIEAMDIERRTTPYSIEMITNEEENSQDIVEKDSINKYKEEISNQDYKIILNDAINSIDETSRTIIKLCFFEGYTQNKIADILQTNNMNVSRKMKKALSKLLEIIKEKGIEKYE